jgi:hypothetical protein
MSQKITDLLARLAKGLEGLEAAPDAESGESMDLEAFVGYASEQIEATSKDSAEVRKARLDHLRGQVAAVVKNFEGPTPGAVTVERFKSGDQKSPTSIEKPIPTSTGQGAGATNFGDAPPAAVAGGVGSQPTGGTNPDAAAVAPGSGFATPAEATFAKALEGLGTLAKTLEGITKGAPAVEPQKPAVQPQKPVEEVAKSADDLWPLDMNSDFGMGKAEAETEPEWGFDRGFKILDEKKDDQAA